MRDSPPLEGLERKPVENAQGGSPNRGGGRRRRRMLLGVLVFLLLGALVLAAIPGASAARQWSRDLESLVTADFQQGQVELETSKGLLAAANTTSDPSKLQDAVHHLQLARAHFKAARSRVDNIPLLAPASGLPGLSHYLKAEQAVVNLSRMGVALCDALQTGAAVDELLIAPAARGGGAAKLLSALKVSGPKLDSIRLNLQIASASLRAIDRTAVPASVARSLAKAGQTIDKAIAGVDDLRKLSPVLLEVLGGNGARTYLIEQVNPAELRSGGGYIGSYSLLSADQGAIKIVKGGGIETVDYPRANVGQAGYVEPPKTSIEFYKEKGWVLGDSNFFPNFPSNARAAEMFAQKELGVKPDGVISIDPDAVAYLLQVTGPLAIPDYKVTVQASTFAEEVFRQQSQGNASFATKKQFLTAAAETIVGALSGLKTDRMATLVQALNQAVETRHLQVYFNSNQVQKQMTEFGWSGVLNPTAATEFMEEIESNFGGSKSNHFIQRSYDVQLSTVGKSLHHQVTVSMKNSTPAGLEGGNRAYRFYVRLYVPASATGLSVAGLKSDDYPNTDFPPGLKLMDGWWQINVDWRLGYGTFSMTFSYDTPWPGAQSNHTIYWQKQPGTGPDAVQIRWSQNGHTLSASSDLSVDRLVVLTPTQVRIEAVNFGKARLPSLSL